MDKQYILEHTDELSAQQLADFIMQGIVTLQELRETGLLDATKRIEILRLLEADKVKKQRAQAARDQADDAAWEKVRYGNETILREWITNNPNNKHIQEAKDQVKFLQEEREKIKTQKQGILDKIRRNPSTYSPNQIKDFLSNNTLTEQDLLDCGIPQSAIDNLENIIAPELDLGKTPGNIPDGFTEVYFWGYTGSGKTTALGAILQMAQKKGYLNIAKGPGYLYAHQLTNIFSDDNIANDFLPATSPIEITQYLPFTLKRKRERRNRSVSLIELSGEIFKLFFFKNGNQPFPTESHEMTFNTLNNYLKSNNRKIHFFFIDYDRENNAIKEDNGLKQSDFLAAASTYFSDNDVFGKTTDAIYVILTKSDLLLDNNGKPVSTHERQKYAREYLKENYKAFMDTLEGICKKHSINGGKLLFYTFSLGKVYFKEICNFEGSAASNIVHILMKRIRKSRKSILDVLNK